MEEGWTTTTTTTTRTTPFRLSAADRSSPIKMTTHPRGKERRRRLPSLDAIPRCCCCTTWVFNRSTRFNALSSDAFMTATTRFFSSSSSSSSSSKRVKAHFCKAFRVAKDILVRRVFWNISPFLGIRDPLPVLSNFSFFLFSSTIFLSFFVSFLSTTNRSIIKKNNDF